MTGKTVKVFVMKCRHYQEYFKVLLSRNRSLLMTTPRIQNHRGQTIKQENLNSQRLIELIIKIFMKFKFR